MEASTEVPTYVNGEPVEEEALSEEKRVNIADEQLDDIEIQIAKRDWVVSGEVKVMDPRSREETPFEFSRTYTQGPLSYTGMLQFTGLIGDRISAVMSQGVSLESVLGDVGVIAGALSQDGGGLSRDDFAGVDSFIRGLAKLATYMPDIVEDSQCIWLRIPLHERPVVKEIWGRSPDEGGLSMQDGEDMLSLFIAQNYQELEDFFVERLPRVLRQARAMRTRRKRLNADDLQRLKPSSTTQVHTLSH